MARQPCHHDGGWGAKSIGGGGAIIVAEGFTAGLYQLVLTQTGLEVGSDRCQQAHSASCAAAIAWNSACWQYILSIPSLVGEGRAIRALVALALI
jgi:hypothetical protein